MGKPSAGTHPKLAAALQRCAQGAERDTAFGQAEATSLNEAYSYLQRAIRLNRMVEWTRAHGTTSQDLSDQSDQGQARVDKDMRVVDVSDRAGRILDQRDGLAPNRGRIAASPALETALRAAVSGVIEKAAEVRNGLLCQRPSGMRPYRIVVLPAGFGGEAGAILKIDDLEALPAVSAMAALQGAYGLSAMEATLAEGLLAEQSLEEIAAGRAVGRETIKTQLKSLFNKTGVNRQSALVKLLATFPRAGDPRRR